MQEGAGQAVHVVMVYGSELRLASTEDKMGPTSTEDRFYMYLDIVYI